MSRQKAEIAIEVADELSRTLAALAEITEIATSAFVQMAAVWEASKKEVPET